MALKKSELKTPILFILGAASLLGLFSEYAVLAAEKFIYGKKYNEFSITESVTHWIIVCVLWGIVGLVLFYIAARVHSYNFMKKEYKPSERGVIIAIMLLSSSIGVKYLLLDGWQMAVDFRQQGWLQFIFLYIYYLFEAVLLLFGAAFFQEGCERLVKFESSHIPWGGAILALTWGLLRFFTTGDIKMALFYTAVAFFIGCAHLAAKKNMYISYLFAAVLIIV